MSADLVARARRDAEEVRRACAHRRSPPDQGQRIVAAEVGGILGLDLDPYDVEDLGYDGRTYYRYAVTVDGLRFEGRFLHDTNGMHRIAVGYTVTRRVRRRFGLGHRVVSRGDVSRVGDLHGFVG